MARAGLLVLAIFTAACGRVAFEPTTDGGVTGSDSDAGPVAPARVQSGVVDVLDADVTRTISINGVDPARSLLVFTVAVASGLPGEVRFVGNLATPTTIELTREDSGAPARIAWFVVEWEGWSVQRGTTTIGALEVEAVGTLAEPVDLARSVVLATGRAGGGLLNDDDLVRTELTAPGQVRCFLGNTVGLPTTIGWQVVEVPSATVQRGLVDLPAGANAVQTAVSPVQPFRSVLMFSYSGTNLDTASAASLVARGDLLSPTEISFERNETMGDLRLAWQLIEIPTASIQRGVEQLFAGTTTRQVMIQPVDIASAFVFGGGFGGTGGTTMNAANGNVGTAWGTATLASSSSIVVERAASNVAGTLPWSVIDLR